MYKLDHTKFASPEGMKVRRMVELNLREVMNNHGGCNWTTEILDDEYCVIRLNYWNVN